MHTPRGNSILDMSTRSAKIQKKNKHKKELYCSMALYSFFLGRSFKVAIHVVGEWHGLHDSCKNYFRASEKKLSFFFFFFPILINFI
jgi:hypothetical protein